MGFLFLAYCGLVLFGPRGFVLCLGQDGHVAVEAAATGVACGVVYSASEMGEQPSMLKGLQVDHCGSCRDTALCLDVVRIEPKRDLVGLVATLRTRLGLRHEFQVSSAVAHRLVGRDYTAVFPPLRCSTVLLI